jgi:hypothetical protein
MSQICKETDGTKQETSYFILPTLLFVDSLQQHSVHATNNTTVFATIL